MPTIGLICVCLLAGLALPLGATALLQCDFESDPARAGWSAQAADAASPAPTWEAGSAHSGTHCLIATRGRWRSPLIPVTPGGYYRADAFIRADGPGLWHVITYNTAGQHWDASVDLAKAQGGECAGTDACADWQLQTTCFRADPGVTHVQLMFEPRGDKRLAVDDVTVQGITARDAAVWVASVAARIPPVNYPPPAGRWKFLPHTKKALRKGTRLRIVLLGSSNMNDIAGGLPELMLRQRYPKADIEPITSVRGSTGCNHFQTPELLQTCILDYHPDLVIVECSSFDSTLDAVRAVVRGIRAQCPAEIVLATSAWSDPAWLTPLDPQGTEFAAGVLRLAAEEKVAFLDLGRPVSRYFADCGKPFEYFRRDTHHYNDRGKQVVAQMVAGFFE